MGDIDYHGRNELLRAFNGINWRERRSPLSALEADVLPYYTDLFATWQPNRLLEKLERAELSGQLHVPLARLRANPKAHSAVAALEVWATAHRFRDEWIIDAAHETARAWLSPHADRSRWYVRYPVIRQPVVAVEQWDGQERLSAYRKRQRALLDYFLRAHVTAVQAQVTGTRHPHAAKHAQWTALHFFGWSAPKIIQYEPTAKGLYRQSVMQVITEFARRVGLTLVSGR